MLRIVVTNSSRALACPSRLLLPRAGVMIGHQGSLVPVNWPGVWNMAANRQGRKYV